MEEKLVKPTRSVAEGAVIELNAAKCCKEHSEYSVSINNEAPETMCYECLQISYHMCREKNFPLAILAGPLMTNGLESLLMPPWKIENR